MSPRLSVLAEISTLFWREVEILFTTTILSSAIWTSYRIRKKDIFILKQAPYQSHESGQSD